MTLIVSLVGQRIVVLERPLTKRYPGYLKVSGCCGWPVGFQARAGLLKVVDKMIPEEKFETEFN